MSATSPGPIELVPIGTIRTGFNRLDQCPTMARHNPEQSTIELFDDYADGLREVELVSHLHVVHWCHKAVRNKLLRRPSNDGSPQRGIFVSRSPHRPNPIAISVVRVISRDGNLLTVSGPDCLDGTPLLDLKPYSPPDDSVADATVQWQACPYRVPASAQ